MQLDPSRSHLSVAFLFSPPHLLLLILAPAAAAAAAAPALKYTTRCTCAAAAIPKMAGVTVCGEFFAFDCEEINLDNKILGEALLPLLERFSRGEFTRVKMLKLVIAALLR